MKRKHHTVLTPEQNQSRWQAAKALLVEIVIDYERKQAQAAQAVVVGAAQEVVSVQCSSVTA